MGWTEYRASFYKNGKVDRKAELDFNFEKDFEILKSSMVGSTYYAALRKKDKNFVFAAVVLTSVRNKHWFAYKDMDESEHPYKYDCPVSILKLLSPTSHEEANKWREKCFKTHEVKKGENSLGKLPIGSVIEFEIFGGHTKRLTKRYPAYQFKTCWWETENGRYYSKKNIPSEYKILSRGGR